MQIVDDYYEDLTPETTLKVLSSLARGEKPKPGPQSSRRTSENIKGMTTCVSAGDGGRGGEGKGLTMQCDARRHSLLEEPYGPGAHCSPEFA